MFVIVNTNHYVSLCCGILCYPTHTLIWLIVLPLQEYGEQVSIPVIETSARTSDNVEQAFLTMVAQIKKRHDPDLMADSDAVRLGGSNPVAGEDSSGSCKCWVKELQNAKHYPWIISRRIHITKCVIKIVTHFTVWCCILWYILIKGNCFSVFICHYEGQWPIIWNSDLGSVCIQLAYI